MAIAGLHNVSMLGNSLLRDSQASRRRENHSAHASSLLQMWRELEDEHVVSHAQERASERMLQQRSDDFSMTDLSDSRNSVHSGVSEDVSVSENEFGEWSPDQFRSQNGNDDSSNFSYENPSHLGEVERIRVRQIFQEWMNNGGRECTSNVSRRNNSSRAQWLGETEQERVRIIRERVQMNSQQRGACGDIREEQSADVGGQIGQVLDGLVVNQNGGRIEHVRRGIRKLCGRQALLDMLKKAERERQTELRGLLEHRAVSNFAHRNRIQSLLRGRFLRNGRMVEGDRATSIAASELGLLRQRQTVSGLREGFFSRLDNSGCGLTSSNRSDTLSNADSDGNRNEQNQVPHSHEVIDGLNDISERENEETDNQRFLDGRTDLVADVEGVSWQETSAHVVQWQEQVSESVDRDRQWSAGVESNESGDVIGQVLGGDRQENLANELSLGTLQNEAGAHSNLQEAGEASYEHFPQDGERNATYGLMNVVENLERNPVESIDGLESASPFEQWHEEDQENMDSGDWQEASVEYNELMAGSNEAASDVHHEDVGNEDGGYDRPQEALDTLDNNDGLQGNTQNWLDSYHNQDPVTIGRTDTFYFPDDDNVQSVELRELLSRRSVSTLLHSGFRESLDQLIQSYVERQNHTSIDWELNETSTTSASLEQDLEQQSRDQNEGQGVSESPAAALPSPRMPPMQPLWDQDSHHYNWAPHDVHHRFGIEWEIINDLRLDMARMQQRMNNMQRMLEACMDMQIELQRSIRQEVSAALNRSGTIDDSLPKDATKWDNVRKGICCICCEGNIDSLLYRCGHMCMCSKCANELVQGGGKCPMCRAPVVEVVRAYSIL